MTTPYQRSALNDVDLSMIARRFWPKVRSGTPDGCWEWTAFCNDGGYGMLRVVGKMELAHRVSWVLHHGPLAEEVQVLHRCDNPPCVNPTHLFTGTNADNVADKVNKGRSHVPQPRKRGEGHPMAKLTWETVRTIRAEWTGAPGQGRQLAERFGVSPATITNILKQKVWRDASVGDPRPSATTTSSGPPADEHGGRSDD